MYWQEVEIEPHLDVFLVKEISSGRQVAMCHNKEDAEYIVGRINRYNHERQIISIWSVDDVQARAKERHFNIINQQALEILHSIEKNHDASIGINWDVIDCHLDDLGK